MRANRPEITKSLFRWLFVGVAATVCFHPFRTSAQINLVQNGGFDLNGSTITGWTYPGFGWIPGYPDDEGVEGGPFVSVSKYISQILPTQPGQTYLLQFSIKSEAAGIGGVPGPYGIGVVWGDQSPITYSMPATEDWITEQIPVVATSSSTLLEFTQVDFSMPYLDAVSVTPAPEPPSVMFLFAGAATLLGRVGMRQFVKHLKMG